MGGKLYVPETETVRARLRERAGEDTARAFDAALAAGQKIKAMRIARDAGVLQDDTGEER